MSMIINKTMELSDLSLKESQGIITELNNLILILKNKDLKISSWYGNFKLSYKENSSERLNRGYNYQPLERAVDDHFFPWFLYWEIIWVVINTKFKKSQKILDMGGSSSLFSYYLASKGFEVVTIDLNKKLVNNANYVSKQMNWNLINYVMDARYLDFNFQFDHITSICVFEHIPMYDRIDISKKIKDLLIDEGHFSITFDYRNPSKKAMINTPEDVQKQFIEASGLRIRGNPIFVDTGSSYLVNAFFHKDVSREEKIRGIMSGEFNLKDLIRHKDFNDYTFGSLFLQK